MDVRYLKMISVPGLALGALSACFPGMLVPSGTTEGGGVHDSMMAMASHADSAQLGELDAARGEVASRPTDAAPARRLGRAVVNAIATKMAERKGLSLVDLVAEADRALLRVARESPADAAACHLDRSMVFAAANRPADELVAINAALAAEPTGVTTRALVSKLVLLGRQSEVRPLCARTRPKVSERGEASSLVVACVDALGQGDLQAALQGWAEPHDDELYLAVVATRQRASQCRSRCDRYELDCRQGCRALACFNACSASKDRCTRSCS